MSDNKYFKRGCRVLKRRRMLKRVLVSFKKRGVTANSLILFALAAILFAVVEAIGLSLTICCAAAIALLARIYFRGII